MSEALSAPHEVALAYRRSVGGADRIFLSGLAKAEIWASRTRRGTTAVPPIDWDPETGEPVEGFVRLADRGVVRSWTWVDRPGPEHPLDRPFAFALVQVDGADTALLHVVDAGTENAMSAGLAVRAEWRAQRVGSILDIRAFVPAAAAVPASPAASDTPGEAGGEVVTELKLHYTYEPGLTMTRFFSSLSERRIEGGRCPSCGAVYVPPRARCPACRAGPMDLLTVPDRGAITAYTVVHLPFPGATIELPFVSAWIRLDGVSVPFAHLLGEVSPDDVRVGQRVEAVWAPDDQLGLTWESIRYFRPVPAGKQ